MNSTNTKPWEIVPDDPRVGDVKDAIFCKHIPMKRLEIFNPRWHDKRALLACYKVGEHNKVTFPKANDLPGEYYISGKVVKRYPKQSNGTIDCYAVPLDKFVPLIITEHCIHEL